MHMIAILIGIGALGATPPPPSPLPPTLSPPPKPPYIPPLPPLAPPPPPGEGDDGPSNTGAIVAAVLVSVGFVALVVASYFVYTRLYPYDPVFD